jgi:hypothetical protein
MVGDWAARGNAYYLPLADTATSGDDYEAEPVAEMTVEQLRAKIEAERSPG